jgi:hypothetical protein
MTRAELMKTIVVTAQYYGRELLPITIEGMADDLRALPTDQALGAYLAWRRNPKRRHMPMPAEIIASLQGEPADALAIGREISSRIRFAVDKVGKYRAAEARKVIGEDGWRVIERFGGWDYVTTHLGTPTLNSQTFYAQVRDLLASHVEFFEKGISIEEAPKIGDRRESGQLALLLHIRLWF